MATVDEVAVKFSVDDSDYNSGLSKIAADFDSKMKSINASATSAGNATSVVFDKASGSFRKAGTEVQKYGRNAQAAAGQSANLAAQFNDIAVQLQSGTSPLTIALQQGTQISQVLNQIGGGGGVSALRALAGGFLSVVNPVSLATIAIIGLSGVVVQYVSSLVGNVPKADDILKEHQRLIKELGPAYEDAIEGQKKYADATNTFTKALIAQNVEVAKQALATKGFGARDDLFSLVLGSSGVGAGRNFQEAFKPAQSAIETFVKTIEAGKPDLDAFRTSLDGLVTNGSLSQDSFNKITTAIKDFIAEEEKLGDVKNLTAAEEAIAKMQEAIARIDSKDAQKAIEDLGKKAVDGNISIEEVRIALVALSREHPDMQGPIMAMQALIDKAAETAGAIANINRQGMGGRVTGGAGINDVQFDNRFGDTKGGDESLNAKLNAQKAKIEKEEKALADQRERARKKAEREAAKKARAEAKQDPFERFQTRISNQTEVAEQEYNAQAKLNPLIEDYGLALETARLYQEGLNAAKQAGLTLSPEEQAALMKQVEGLALIRAESERLAEEQAKVKQSFEEWNDTAKSAVGGFLQDLQNGVSLADALHNALDKVLDKLIEVGLNSIFDSKTGIFGGGGLGSIFSSFFGGARATGGPVNPNKAYLVGENGPELMVPGQSGTIIPNSRLAAATAGSVTNSGSQALDVHFVADVDGNGNITPYVTSVAKRESNTAVARSNKNEVKRLPGNLQAARQRGLTGR